MEGLRFIFRSLFRKKFRAFLTIFSISIGVASILVIGMVSSVGKDAIENELDSLGINGISVSAVQAGVELDANDLELIRSLSFVENAMPIVASSGAARFGAQTNEAFFWGIDSGADQVISLEIKYGRAIDKADVLKCDHVCLVDSGTAKSLFKRENIVGSQVSVAINGVSQNYTVVGVADASSSLLQNIVGEYLPTIIYFPYTTLQQELGSNTLNQIAVRIKDADNTDAAGERVAQAVSVSKSVEDAVKCDNLAKGRDKLNQMLKIITLILSAIGAISLIVAGLGTMTVMLVSVSERTSEIGIKKSIGASKWCIMREFILESLILTLAGSFVGILLTQLVAWTASHFLGFSIGIGLGQLQLAIGIALVFGVVFGVYPAVSAAKLNPVDALRKD